MPLVIEDVVLPYLAQHSPDLPTYLGVCARLGFDASLHPAIARAWNRQHPDQPIPDIRKQRKRSVTP